MSVISVQMLPKRYAVSDRDGTTVTRKWLVQVDSSYDNEMTIAPVMTSYIAGQNPGPFFRIESTQIEDHKGDFWWMVTTNYTNKPADGTKPDDDGDNDPLNDPAEIEWDSGEGRETIHIDLDNKPILNSAEDPFDTNPEIEVARPVLVVTKNFATFEGDTAYEYANSVNKSDFYGAKKGTLRLRKLRARRQVRNGTKYWSVTFEFAYDPNGWQLKALDAGYNHLVKNSSGTWVKTAIQVDGSDAKKPQMLDGDGQPISIEALRNGTPPKFLDFRTRKEKDFNQLNLGLT